MIYQFADSRVCRPSRTECHLLLSASWPNGTAAAHNHAMILPYHATPRRMEFSERTTAPHSYSFQKFDQIPLVGLAEAQLAMLIVVVHYVQECGEPAVMEEPAVLMGP